MFFTLLLQIPLTLKYRKSNERNKKTTLNKFGIQTYYE